MMYQVTCEAAENDLPDSYIRIIPIYKSLKDDLTNEIDWIHTYKDFIVGATCEYIWELYCGEFLDRKILSKNNFYKLVKKELSLEGKIIRMSQDATKYCFTEKSKED